MAYWVGRKEIFYLTTHSTHFIYSYMEGREEIFYLTTHSTHFILRLYGVRHMVKDHSDSERGNPLPPHRLLFPIGSKGSFIFIIHRQDNTYHGLCYTSRGALAGTRNSLLGRC